MSTPIGKIKTEAQVFSFMISFAFSRKAVETQEAGKAVNFCVPAQQTKEDGKNGH